ncbi:hypothetical protein HII13_000854 [Brettanomyces bruxellensis]|nr:hypothetical protein HII13_000854 [Brettanomyces bruxellensis]
MSSPSTSPSGSVVPSSRVSTPSTSVYGSDEEEGEDKEEKRILKLLEQKYANDTNSSEQFKKEVKEFEGLSNGRKLKKLDELVKRSQLFSSIIANTLLESRPSSQGKNEKIRKHLGDTSKSNVSNFTGPLKKKQRTQENKTKGKMIQSKITDLLKIKSNVKKRDAKVSQNSLKKFERPNIGQPKLITGCRMKDYQVTGMQWLVTLYQNGLNGILADEMGLGKTLESIAMLAYLYEQGISGPFLICCPLSTVSNWVDEFHRFASTFNVIAYVGPKDKRANLRRTLFHANVVVTSYEISIRDSKYLEKKDWKYLIVDEGHRLKNSHCLLIQQLKRIRTSNRLLLTGTPLQNNLDELWSLLNFILPDIFHDVEVFQQWFDFSAFENLKEDSSSAVSQHFNDIVSLEIQKTLVKNLHTILKPFLLRRLKKDVMKGLPPKREYIIYSKLSKKQDLIYKAILSRHLKDLLYIQGFEDYMSLNHNASERSYSKSDLKKYVLSQLHDENPKEDNDLSKHWSFVRQQVNRKKLQNVMMQLRLVCDSPYLFFFPWNDDTKLTSDLIQNSCKLQILDQLLPLLLKQKHKVLIFSQFTGMLDILQSYLTEIRDICCCRIDGSTSQSDREFLISEFNKIASKSGVFLLSTRAGGLGINLTAADTVILFDSDWNPQVDLQAMDRVHRIGQTKPVLVYRLVCAHTIEEFLLAKADSKRRLEKLVIQLGDFHTLLQKPSEMHLTFRRKKQVPNTNDELLDNLKKFLDSKTVKTKDIDSNVLSEADITDLLDRSESAYTRRNAGEQTADGKKSHISLFETVSTMA